MKLIQHINLLVHAIIIIACLGLNSCCSQPNVPLDTKHLTEFDKFTNSESVNPVDNNLSLYVDYSNCISQGMQSPFYQSMVSPLTAATKNYMSIKGDAITKEKEDVYTLLNNVEEVDYAALDKAINMMADSDSESVLLTDGELFTQTSTKNNPNNPYMHAAFKKWILKGHDIHILAEPYVETYKGQQFNKKRFYIIFTDDRLPGNVYSRIKEVVDLSAFPQVDEFHLSGNYPWLLQDNGVQSKPNENLAAETKGYSTFEIQDWPLDWKTIQAVIMQAYDEETGEPKENGEPLITGLTVNRNAFGAYRIKDIDVKVYNINSEYFDIYNSLEAGEKVGPKTFDFMELPDFITYDEKEFNRHSKVNLYFDVEDFAPDKTQLNGNPYNYFKIVISVDEIENVVDNHTDLFKFDSIVQGGQTNVSIAESLKNCVFDPEIINSLQGKVLYTIYVKSEKY